MGGEQTNRRHRQDMVDPAYRVREAVDETVRVAEARMGVRRARHRNQRCRNGEKKPSHMRLACGDRVSMRRSASGRKPRLRSGHGGARGASRRRSPPFASRAPLG